MRFGIVVFPGTWSEGDCFRAVHGILGQKARYVWHHESDLSDLDVVLLPGGFSYGDYLRAGAIARFSPVMEAVRHFASKGGQVLGICNGFQILCESGLLPGALLHNDHLQFRCEWVHLRVEHTNSPFTRYCEHGQVLRVPISHGEGQYHCDPATLVGLNQGNQVLFRYCTPSGEIVSAANPNGSLENIAGISNLEGNVVGMMPHPERCCDQILGGVDGLNIFKSLLHTAEEARN